MFSPTCYSESGLQVHIVSLVSKELWLNAIHLETRLLDFTVCDDQGSVICIMHGLELRKVSSVPTKPVDVRYDLVYQPVSVDVRPSQLTNKLAIHDVNDLHDLLNVLDGLSLEFLSSIVQQELPNSDKVIQHSLLSGIVTEKSAMQTHQKRYLAFAHRALETSFSPLPSLAELEGLRSRWPVCFEMIEKLSSVPNTLFASSKVFFLLCCIAHF